MNQNTDQDFRKIAIETRYLLLLSITYIRKKAHIGASEIAIEITTTAIEHNLIEARPPPTGAMLQRWIKNKNPPAWAIKGATLLLTNSTKFEPNEKEQIPFAFTLIDLYPDESSENIFHKIPPNIRTTVPLELLEKAKRAVGKKKSFGGDGIH